MNKKKKEAKMKQAIKLLFLVVGICCWFSVAYAEDKHGHGHAHQDAAGPRGGKLLENSPPHAEFLVEEDRTVSFAFYDEKLKPVAASLQKITVIAEAKSGRVKFSFDKRDGKLISKQKLPEGDGYQVVVLLKSKPGGKSESFRFEFHDDEDNEDAHKHGKEVHSEEDGHAH